MNARRVWFRWLVIDAVAAFLATIAPGVAAQPWLNESEAAPVFEPTRVLEITLTMEKKDWDTIRYDSTYEIYVPAWFQATDDQAPKPVMVRRKSSRALPDEGDPWKFGMKIDLNDVDDSAWRGLTKLSLENGGDISPVAEGLMWNLHRLASHGGESGYNYDAGLAAWVNVTLVLTGGDTVAGNPDAHTYNLGVFTNVEQRDKQFAKNRGLWVKDRSWIYEQDDINSPVIEEGPDTHSPQFQALCYPPFRASGKKGGGCVTPGDTQLYNELTALIDMEAMLTYAAIDAFCDNSDGLFTHGKNFLWGDYTWNGALKRQYYVWDLDTGFRDVNALIYANSVSTKRGKTTYNQSPYQQIILSHPDFRQQYNAIFTELLQGPLSEDSIDGFLDSVESALTPYLAADPYIQAGGVIAESIPEHFQSLRDWVSRRIPAVLAQISANDTPPPRPR